MATALSAQKINVYYGASHALQDVSLDFETGGVTALIGPSGCGKSTFLRCLNRMNDLIPGCRVEGRIMLDGEDVNQPRTNVVRLRQKVGMVFQKPNPFPKSIFENVAYGLRVNGVRDENLITEKVELALRRAALWNEVEDRLSSSALGLSGGQQQRLCIARALAVEPQVLLMDEPASALDPIATRKVEESIVELKEGLTIIIVTHSMQQAARISDRTAFFYMGRLVESDSTDVIFTRPSQKETEDYITGRLMVLQDYTPQHMLATLRTRLLVMYAQVDIALEEAARSYEKGEAVRAIAVCDGDTAIDALENEIDELCLRLMARIKPVAGDLRFVVAALRMVVDLERIGDEAVTVAEQTVLMEDVPGRRILTDEVCGMMQRAREAFMRAMDCFREGNGQEALALRNCEDEALQNEMRIVQRLLELLRQEEDKRPDPQLVMHTLLVVRALTRIWRRSVNLAEQVYFMQHGQSLKHSADKK